MFLVLLVCAILTVFTCICAASVFLIYQVNDSHGASEDITDILKDINDNLFDGDGSMHLSVTQLQSVDGTEHVTQAENVPMQLQLEDVRKKKEEV